jgi:hypothetical protein
MSSNKRDYLLFLEDIIEVLGQEKETSPFA